MSCRRAEKRAFCFAGPPAAAKAALGPPRSFFSLLFYFSFYVPQLPQYRPPPDDRTTKLSSFSSAPLEVLFRPFSKEAFVQISSGAPFSLRPGAPNPLPSCLITGKLFTRAGEADGAAAPEPRHAAGAAHGPARPGPADRPHTAPGPRVPRRPLPGAGGGGRSGAGRLLPAGPGPLSERSRRESGARRGQSGGGWDKSGASATGPGSALCRCGRRGRH